MKKWLRFFCLSFFSDKISKEGAKRGYTNVFLGLLLAFVFLWSGFVGGDMLPFAAHYHNSPDFEATVRAVLANPDVNKRLSIEICEGRLMIKQNDEYRAALLVNTLESDADRKNYSVNGYNVIVDTRPADALAEIEAYCVSNDGKNTEISYEDYLTLSEVARLNFDFKLRYTGNELVLTDEMTKQQGMYLESLGGEIRDKAVKYTEDLAENKITASECQRAIYELYFENYYPEITAYESTSKVPLLRNYYYHQYIREGINKYIFIFDDYLAASFETESGIDTSFYGFYSNMEDGIVVASDAKQAQANMAADDFIKESFNSTLPLTLYAHVMNVFSLIPFIALMPMVVTLLAYSILRLSGVEGITSLGTMFKIVGSYVWFSGVVSAVLAVIVSFFVQHNILTLLPLLLFFITLMIRSMIFVIKETKVYKKRLEQQETVQTEA